MISLRDSHRKLVIQFLKFGIIGGLGFGIDLSFFHLGLDVFGFGHYGSALFSFPFAASFTWIGNRLYTFRGRHTGRASVQWIRFLIVCAIGFAVNRGTYSLLIATFPLVYDHPVLGLLGGTGASMFFNFFSARKLVFR